jgi:hypothetical protein
MIGLRQGWILFGPSQPTHDAFSAIEVLLHKLLESPEAERM